jgi:hypothetical protein
VLLESRPSGMRQFGSTGFRLWNLGREAKVLYSAFCVLAFLGIASSALYYLDLTGAGLRGVRRYYAAEVEPAAAGAGAASGGAAAAPEAAGPAIELPPSAEEDDPDRRGPIVVTVSYRKLLEATHFHLFTMPVLLLILGHLFLATGVSDRAKLAWIAAGSASVALHLATPWLVHFAGAGFAFLHALSGVALLGTMTVLTIHPMLAMWRPSASRRARADADDAAAAHR